MITVRLPAAVDQAMQFDNAGLWEDIGAKFTARYVRRGKGHRLELTASPEDLAKIAIEIKDRISMNGGEGYEDGPSALRACRTALDRITAVLR